MRWVWALGLVLLFSSAARAQDETPDPYQSAYDAASGLAAEGKWKEAAEGFRQAVRLRPTAVGLFNLAQAERNAGQLTEARRDFERAQASARDEGATDVEHLAASALAALEQQIPKLRVRAPEGATVTLDGEEVDASRSVELTTGSHRVEVRVAGKPPFVREVTARSGQTVEVVARFPKPIPSPEPKVAPPPPPRTVSSAGPPTGAVISLGVGAAAMVAGVVFHLRRNEKLSDAAADCIRQGNGWSCPPALEHDPAHQEAKDQASSAELARNVLFGVGAAAALTGGVWWALSSGKERTQVAITPTSARLRMAF
ncbi:MAG: PEGA domain-containing protein [Myxococcales bacterium]|nr:PEGA domain-containing protein [Myxococcales bacterium]MCB9580845.1 PEGA domain-containing protein [Polyangiaceae bacterium]